MQWNSLANTYPPENKKLYERIVAEDAGAILSELSLHEPPTAENFPPRNRIIAGISLGILVIEANLKSGSLITARLAADDYNREVFALPGRVDSPASSGTHHLLKTGSAHLVENVDDVLDALGDAGQSLKQLAAAAIPDSAAAPVETPEPKIDDSLFPAVGTQNSQAESKTIHTPAQQKLLAVLNAKPQSIDDLCDLSELPPAVVVAELTFLQIRGLVVRAANAYALKPGAH